ncbi:MAG TPA: RNA polymerase sigma factor [Devosia sp.]|nr:RNA polymerase sigma factor [Devosia sp.]
MASLSQIELLLPELRAYARSISQSGHDAEDLVHDAIERVLRSSAQPSKLDELRPWFFRVIRNLNIDEFRKKRVRMEYFQAQSLAVTDLNQHADHENDILCRLAFERLPADAREVLFLVDIMGLKYSEAAEVMDVPVGTVMSRLSRGRRALIGLVGDRNENGSAMDGQK